MCYVQVAYFYEAWCILKIRLQMFGIKSFNNDNVAVGQEQNDQTKVNQACQIAYITFQNGTNVNCYIMLAVAQQDFLEPLCRRSIITAFFCNQASFSSVT